MRQAEIMNLVVTMARQRGWRVAHFDSVETVIPGGDGRTRWMTPARADGRGFPDLLLVRERVLVAEVKGGAHKPSAAQAEWMFAFRIAGVRAHVWTPAGLADGSIEAELDLRIPYQPVQGANVSA